MNEDVSVLQYAVHHHPFLKGMTVKHLQLLTDCAMLTHFDAGQVVFHESEIANRFYLIQRGKIRIEARSGETTTLVIQTVGAGDVLGWSWLFPPYYWHFGAYALEKTEAIFFYGTRLRESCEEDRSFGYALMKRVSGVLIQRLQGTIREAVDLAGSMRAGPRSGDV